MKAFGAFLVYFFGCLLLAAIVLPFVHPWLAAAVGDSARPDRSLYRLAMLFMLAGLPWFLQRQRLLGWRQLGFTLPAGPAWTAVCQGLAIGTVMLAVLVVGLLLVGAREFAPPADLGAAEFLEAVLAGLIAGLLVGLIEEVFFRGMMHTGLRRTLDFWPTALLTATFYAAVHFIRPAELPAGAELNIAASLTMLWLGLSGLAELATIHDSLITLFAAGVLLAMVRERRGNVLWCIGIHAGWVMVIRVTKDLTEAESAAASIWIGHYDRITGLMAAIWLTLLAGAFWYGRRSRG